MFLQKNHIRFSLIIIAVVIVPLVSTIQNITLGENYFWGDIPYTFYNNYVIFKQSFIHLFNNKDLYAAYPYEYGDFYKYSPTFAVFMAPFYILPDWLGLFLWSFINASVLIFALHKIIADKSKLTIILLAILPELFLTVANSQCNALIAGCILLSYHSLESKRPGMAALLITFTVFIKLFSVVCFALFLFYPGKTKNALRVLICLIIFLLLPLLLISPSGLYVQYFSWNELLRADHSISYGISLGGMLSSFLSFEVSKMAILIFGSVLFLISLARIDKWNDHSYKKTFLCFLFIWMVLLNHKAESPSYILVLSGTALWSCFSDFSKETVTMLILTFIFSSLVSTDLCPKYLRDNFIEPYCIKALIPSFSMLLMTYQLAFSKNVSVQPAH